MRPWTAAFFGLILVSRAAAESPWVALPSGTTERLRGVAAVDDRVVWASGNHGTCLRTIDGGITWQKLTVPGADGLDFRDVEAFDARTAFLLAIGPGEASRIFKTTDGGTTWVESYRNHDPRGFLDAIAFWDRDHGLALGDPVDGRFVILATSDGGKTWDQTSGEGTMPAALPNEGAFAASGTCLVVAEGGHAWFATGGGASARVFRSIDRGQSWAVADAPVLAGQPSAGVFSLAFRDANSGVAVGGDYKAIAEVAANVATTADGGVTWEVPAERRRAMGHRLNPNGFRSAVAFIPAQPRPTLLAVGPTGADWGSNDGSSWRPVELQIEPCFGPDVPPGTEWHALAVAPSGRFAWAVGEGGKIGRLDVADAIKGR